MTTKSPPPARALIQVKSASTSVPPPIRPMPSVVSAGHIGRVTRQVVVVMRLRCAAEQRAERAHDDRDQDEASVSHGSLQGAL